MLSTGYIYINPSESYSKTLKRVIILTSNGWEDITQIKHGENGRIGIGTASPETALHVNGSLTLGDTGPINAGGTHTDAQLILGGTHNEGYNNNGKIKLLITGGNNDGSSPYDIMCEDEATNPEPTRQRVNW